MSTRQELEIEEDWVAFVYEEESYGITVTEVDVHWPRMEQGARPTRDWAMKVLESIAEAEE